MTSALAIRSERIEQTRPVARTRYVSRFNSEFGLPSLKQIKLERIMRKESKRTVSISTRRIVTIDPKGRECVHLMEYYPHEKRVVEAGPNGSVIEYTFDFSKWKELAKTDRLGAKLLYFYYRDIFGYPRKQSMDMSQLEQRYGIIQKEIEEIIQRSKLIVCKVQTIKNETS